MLFAAACGGCQVMDLHLKKRDVLDAFGAQQEDQH